MRKYVVIVTVIVIIICLFLCLQPKVKFNNASSGTAKFIYGDVKIETEISDKHLKQITEIFENKRLKKESPSCGFDEDVSVKIDNKTFCIACDTCGIIYLHEKDRYFHLSDEENERLRKILEGYGFEFPCV